MVVRVKDGNEVGRLLHGLLYMFSGDWFGRPQHNKQCLSTSSPHRRCTGTHSAKSVIVVAILTGHFARASQVYTSNNGVLNATIGMLRHK